MTQYNMLNVKLSNSQLNKLKSAIKNGTEVTLNLSSNLIGSSDDEINVPHKILLTDTQVSKIPKAFSNGSSANIKFSKAQLSMMIQSGGFTFSDFLDLIDPKIYGTGIALTNYEIKDMMKVIKSLENRGTLLKGTTTKITNQEGGFLNFLRPLITALPLMKSVLTPSAKSVLIPLGFSAEMSVVDAAIQKKIYESGRPSDLDLRRSALLISNEESEVIMKIVKSLEESGLLIKGISETIKNEAKERKGGFLSMLFGTLAARILGNTLTGKGVKELMKAQLEQTRVFNAA